MEVNRERERNSNFKDAGVVILTPDKGNIKTKGFTRHNYKFIRKT